MKPPRFTLLKLMIFIAIVALGLTFARNPTYLTELLIHNLVLLVLATSLVGAIFSIGGRRAFWTGFAIVGWGYFLLAFGTGHFNRDQHFRDRKRSLATSAAIDFANARRATYVTGYEGITELIFYKDPAHLGYPKELLTNFENAPTGQVWRIWTTPARNPGRLYSGPNTLLANSDYTWLTGHDVFNVILGLSGGLIARAFYQRRKAHVSLSK